MAQSTKRDFGEWVQAGRRTGCLDLGTVRRRPASLAQRGAGVGIEPPAFIQRCRMPRSYQSIIADVADMPELGRYLEYDHRHHAELLR